MKAVLYPAASQDIHAILGGQKVFWNTVRSMNETGQTMRVLLYETKNSGGCGKIVAIMWIGPGYEVPRPAVDELALLAYCPEAAFSACHLGARKLWCYEILHVQRLAEPAEIASIVWKGSTKPPQTWKHVEI